MFTNYVNIKIYVPVTVTTLWHPCALVRRTTDHDPQCIYIYNVPTLEKITSCKINKNRHLIYNMIRLYYVTL